jgi:hypothetical protein
MEIIGKLTEILDEQTGEGKNGPWRKGGFVIETEGQYPKKVCFDVWGDKIDDLKNLTVGSGVNVGFDIESREYNGKWFTNAKAWRFDAKGSEAPSAPDAGGIPLPSDDDAPSANMGADDDLPF